VENSRPSHDGDPVGDFSATADEVTCRQFVELVTDYFEGTLEPQTLSQVEEHLVLCDWCATYMEQMAMTIASLRELREPAASEPPAALLTALRARKLNWRNGTRARTTYGYEREAEARPDA
jgi:predicted anti-sigma-YlaC factor YlaD